MAINKSEKIFCKYCKRLLTDEHEKELHYHLACEKDVQDFSVSETNNIKKLMYAFGTKDFDTSKIHFPGPVLFTYKLNKNNDIVDILFRNFVLKSLPNSIASLTKLDKLSITYNLDEEYFHTPALPSLGYLPDSFCELENLRHLDLRGNHIGRLPAKFGNLSMLQSLNLFANRLNQLPNSFKNLQNLLTLDLSYNIFDSFPTEIFDLKNIKNLNVMANQISFIPDSFKKVINLSVLDLRKNQLVSIPNSISHLPNLKCLLVDTNNLRFIPESIGHLTKLQVLNLDQNKSLRYLPDAIEKLINLRKLYLGGTGIATIPEFIGNLVNLNTIGLSLNQTVSFSKFGLDLPSLQKIIIYPDAYRNWGWDSVSHIYHHPPLDDFTKLPASTRDFFKELSSRGCKIQISNY